MDAWGHRVEARAPRLPTGAAEAQDVPPPPGCEQSGNWASAPGRRAGQPELCHARSHHEGHHLSAAATPLQLDALCCCGRASDVSNRGPVRVVEKALFLPTLKIPTRRGPDEGALGMLRAHAECCPCPWLPARAQASSPHRKELWGEQPRRELRPAHHCPSTGWKRGARRFPEQGSVCLCTMRLFPPTEDTTCCRMEGVPSPKTEPILDMGIPSRMSADPGSRSQARGGRGAGCAGAWRAAWPGRRLPLTSGLAAGPQGAAS